MEYLFELVARHAAHSESKIAVSRWRPGADFVETSYGVLTRTAQRFAGQLAALTSAQTMIPMLVGRSADSIALMLGAMAAARPFCFVNPKYRGPQIAAVLVATGSPICVADAAGLVALRGAWKDHGQIARTIWLVVGGAGLTGIYAEAVQDLREVAEVIFLDEEEGGQERHTAERDSARSNVPATCLFTSGSTGEPKGVLISEADLMRRVAAEIAWFSLTNQDVLLGILPFSFDVGLNQLMTALAVGAELVLLDSWLPADILTVTEKRQVTGISSVPSIWQDVINSGVRFDKSGRHAALRYVTISGGSLSREYLERLPAVVGGTKIFKTYGQTEAFRATSLRPEEYQNKIDSVGKPFSGVHVYVVADDGTRCGVGDVGEVVHTGLGIMMGYLGNPGDDAEQHSKLRPNPFYGEDDPSPVAVFTGDMGYVDDDGYLYLKGRRDSMLKVMGNRVYPQEVTNQIATIPGVREAVVVGVPREDGQTMVVAFLSVLRGAELSAATVRRTLNARLPGFMIPKEIVFVDHVPRTATGKPDQRRLLEDFAATAHDGETRERKSRSAGGLNV